MAKIKITERTGADLFHYLELADEDKNRANEWAVTYFVEIDESPMTLEQFIKLSNEQQIIIKGRIFTLKIKGVKQDDNFLYFKEKDLNIKRKEISYDFLESLQLKIQRLNERGETSATTIIIEAIQMFYDISLEDLEKMPYQISAFMFNYINSFLTRTTESQDEFDI